MLSLIYSPFSWFPRRRPAGVPIPVTVASHPRRRPAGARPSSRFTNYGELIVFGNRYGS